MHRLHKVSKASGAAAAVWTIPWFVLNFLAYSALSFWIAARGLYQGAFHRTGRK